MEQFFKKKSKMVSPNMDESDGEDKPLFLCYVHKIGGSVKKNYEYEFIFTENIEDVIGDNWAIDNKFLLEEDVYESDDLLPNEKFINKVSRLSTKVELKTIAELSSDFQVMDAVYGIVSLAWEYIDDYREIGELPNELLVFKFGDRFEDVENKLFKRNLKFVY